MIGVLGLVACGGGGKDDEGTTAGDGDGDGDTNPNACANTISDTFPADGATDAFYKTNVEFTLLTAEASATITVTGPSGDVAGSTAVEGNTVVWTPDGDLDPSTAYEATLTYSCDPATVGFSTSDVGTPAATADIDGGVYSLPLTEGRFVEPPGIGEIIGGLIAVTVLIETSLEGTDLNMMGALALDTDPNAQDMCTETIDFPQAADFSQNPFFTVGPDNTVISVAGFDVAIDDLAISGAFSPNGDRIAGAALSGSIDTRPLVPLVAEGQGDSGVCDLVGGFGISCIACSDGTGDFCLALEVEDMTALKAGGVDLLPVTADDVANNPACATAGS
jgi:hypothetical protein